MGGMSDREWAFIFLTSRPPQNTTIHASSSQRIGLAQAALERVNSERYDPSVGEFKGERIIQCPA